MARVLQTKNFLINGHVFVNIAIWAFLQQFVNNASVLICNH